MGNLNKNVVNDESNVFDNNVKNRFKGLLDKFENLKVVKLKIVRQKKNNIGNISYQSFNFTKLKSFWE